MSELEAPQQKEFGHITTAEFVAHSAEQHLKNNIGGDFNKVERRNRTLITVRSLKVRRHDLYWNMS